MGSSLALADTDDRLFVRDRHAVGIARQIGEHRLGAGERRFCIDHLVLFADRRQVPQERAAVGQVREAAVERESARRVQRH